MAVFHKLNAILLQISHHFKAHRLYFSVSFQHGRPAYGVNTSVTWTTQDQSISLRIPAITAFDAFFLGLGQERVFTHLQHVDLTFRHRASSV